MKKVLRWIYYIAGILCFAYFLVMGLWSRFGLNLSWIWIAGGIVFLAAGYLCCKPIPKWMRWGWRGLLCAGVAMVLFLETFVISGMNSIAPANMDYLIVLGSRVDPDGPSPSLRRRLNAAMDYLENSPDTIIIASGGQGRDEPMSEAQCIRDELVAMGIDESRILLEDKSTATNENIAYSMAMMEDPSASVGIITNNYHVYRAQRIAEKAGLTNARGIASEYTGPTLFHYMLREAVCLVADFLRGNI